MMLEARVRPCKSKRRWARWEWRRMGWKKSLDFHFTNSKRENCFSNCFFLLFFFAIFHCTHWSFSSVAISIVIAVIITVMGNHRKSFSRKCWCQAKHKNIQSRKRNSKQIKEEENGNENKIHTNMTEDVTELKYRARRKYINKVKKKPYLFLFWSHIFSMLSFPFCYCFSARLVHIHLHSYLCDIKNTKWMPAKWRCTKKKSDD